MALKLSDLQGSIDRFLEAWRIVRICPDKINAPREQLSLNLLTLTVVLIIFYLARMSIAGAERTIASDLFSTVVSGLIVFLTGYITLIFDPTRKGLERARKWGIFFVLVWITSLLAIILIDGIAVWTHVSPLTSLAIDTLFVPGSLSPVVKNTFRAFFFGLLALTILLIKTRRMDPAFSIRSSCAALTVLFGLTMNTILLLLFLYGNLI